MSSEKMGLKVWIVVGDSGEYSDWQMWIVAAYDNQEEAEAHANKAQHHHDAEVKLQEGMEYQERAARRWSNPFDPSQGEVDPVYEARYSVEVVDPILLRGTR